ncbi:MAG: hypothetical protein ACYTG2_07310 [Planctomycetota bacterium]|jgi:hypothetical protein
MSNPLRVARGALLLLAVSVVAWTGPGCTIVTVRYGHPVPGAQALLGVVPGSSTEAEAIAALGVPEEYASPNTLAFGRAWDPARQRVEEERDLTDRRILTWVYETRTRSEFAVLPSVPLLADFLTFFSTSTLVHRAERVVVLLDGSGVVTAVGRTSEEGS